MTRLAVQALRLTRKPASLLDETPLRNVVTARPKKPSAAHRRPPPRHVPPPLHAAPALEPDPSPATGKILRALGRNAYCKPLRPRHKVRWNRKRRPGGPPSGRGVDGVRRLARCSLEKVGAVAEESRHAPTAPPGAGVGRPCPPRGTSPR